MNDETNDSRTLLLQAMAQNRAAPEPPMKTPEQG